LHLTNANAYNEYIIQHTNNKATPSRAKIITNQLIRMSSMPKIMSSVTFTRHCNRWCKQRYNSY